MAFMILAIVATPFLFTAWLINRILEHRKSMRGLTATVGELRALTAARDELEARVQTLEEIVTSQEFELDRRLRQAS